MCAMDDKIRISILFGIMIPNIVCNIIGLIKTFIFVQQK